MPKKASGMRLCITECHPNYSQYILCDNCGRVQTAESEMYSCPYCKAKVKFCDQECWKFSHVPKCVGMKEGKPIRKCGGCGKKENDIKFQKCGRCKAKYYCDNDCFTIDWKYHKRTCKPVG